MRVRRSSRRRVGYAGCRGQDRCPPSPTQLVHRATAHAGTMRDLTDRPFGVNIAQLFVRDPGIVDFVVAQGVKFVTTSAGDPRRYTAQLKAAGLTVFHVVPSLDAALKAVAAGVDGLVVEGGEGGGFKNPRDVATMLTVADPRRSACDGRPRARPGARRELLRLRGRRPVRRPRGACGGCTRSTGLRASGARRRRGPSRGRWRACAGGIRSFR